MVLVNSICSIFSAIVDNFVCFEIILSAPTVIVFVLAEREMSKFTVTSVQLQASATDEKTKINNWERDGAAKICANFLNASIFLFRQLGEIRHQFSRLMDPYQLLHMRLQLIPFKSYHRNLYDIYIDFLA